MTEVPPSNTELAMRWIQHGMRLRDQKQWLEALESFEKALALDSRNPQAWALKGRALDEMGNLSEAIRCYKTSLEINPNSASTYNNQGYAFRKQQKYTAALECYREATRLQPNYAKAWYNMGYVLDKQGNYEEAIEAFNRAIELAPDNEKYVASRQAVEATWREFQKVFSSSSSSTALSTAKESSELSLPTPKSVAAAPPSVPSADFNPFLDFETSVPEMDKTSIHNSTSASANPHAALTRPTSPPLDAPDQLRSSQSESMPVLMKTTVLGRASMDEGLMHFAYVPTNPTPATATTTTATIPSAVPVAPASAHHLLRHGGLATASSSSPALNMGHQVERLQSSSSSITPTTAAASAASTGERHAPPQKEQRRSSAERPAPRYRLDDAGSVPTNPSPAENHNNASAIPPLMLHSRSLNSPSLPSRSGSSSVPRSAPQSPKLPPVTLQLASNGIEQSQQTSQPQQPPQPPQQQQPQQRIITNGIEKFASPAEVDKPTTLSQADASSLLTTLQKTIPQTTVGGSATIQPSTDGSDTEPELVQVGIPRAKTYLEAIYTHLQGVKTVKDAEKLESALEEMLAAVRVKRAFLASKQSSEKEVVCACCWDKPPEMVCIPCGHLCICEECKYKLRQKKCPVCSQRVKNIYKVFK